MPSPIDVGGLGGRPVLLLNTDTSRYRRMAQVSVTTKATAVTRRRARAGTPRVHLAMNCSKELPLLFSPPSRFF
jgi:hypothetical protein